MLHDIKAITAPWSYSAAHSHHILTSLLGDYVGQTRHLRLHHGEEDGDVMRWTFLHLGLRVCTRPRKLSK